MNAAQTNGVAITPRKVIDSSQAQGVPLNVVARLADAPRVTPGAAIAQALNHYASALPEFMANQQRQRAEQQAAQDKLDAADGKQMATEAHATGSTPDRLRYMSDATQQSYQQADGVLAASEFENFVRTDLARLEADADGAGPTVDRFMQGKVREYIEQKGLPEEARKTFMAGVAQKQDALKQEYLKQSITENLHRQVDAFGAFATNSIQNGDADPRGVREPAHVRRRPTRPD